MGWFDRRTTHSTAKGTYERIVHAIREEQKALTPDQELVLVCEGSGGEMLRVDSLGYYDPDLIVVRGKVTEGPDTQLLMHYSRILLTLKRVAIAPTAKRCAIGFKGRCD